MTVLGNLAIIAALLTAAASGFTSFRSASGSGPRSSISRMLIRLHALSVVLASLLLVTLFLTHDFSNGYVYSHSDRSLPLYYLLSGFYAGQEGSFLFWALCSSMIALVLMRFTARRKIEHQVMAVFMAIQSILLLLVLVKSPFRSLWEMFPDAPAGQLPSDGSGLNPLLQNFWMVIHPPVLFLGFAAMTAPFAFAIAGLWKRMDDILAERALPWVLFAVAVLGLGIMLGGYWAYGVLGWGGYWGWDPVENSSLVPWLTAMGLVHTLLAQMRTGRFVRTNFFLAILSFALVVYSTFLTRSGVLGDASVHSFADPGAAVYWVLLAFLGLLVMGGVGLLVMRWRELAPKETGSDLMTREVALGAGTIALLLSAGVVLFGTSLPIFSSIRAERSFYDATNLPIAIAMSLLIGFSLYMQWEMQDAKETLRRSWKTLLASLLVTVILVVAGMQNAVAAAFVFAAVFALMVNVEIGLRVARGDPRFLGGKVAHIGLALFLLGVISTGKFSTTERLSLPRNVPQQALGYTLTYTGSVARPDGKFAFPVSVERSGASLTLTPVMFEAGQQGIMKNPDIASSLLRDFYLSPLALEQSTGGPEGGESVRLEKGRESIIGGARARFVSFDMSGRGAKEMGGAGGMPIGSILEITEGNEREMLTPVTLFRGAEQPVYTPAQSRILKASVRLLRMEVGMSGGPSAVTVEVHRPNPVPGPPEVLIVEASVKPMINLLWGGTLVMMSGFVLSILKRSKES